MSDELNVAQFKPTPTMEKWLDTHIELKTDEIIDIAEKSNINRSSWYKWKQIPGFMDWYLNTYEKRVKEWRPYLDAVGLRKAKSDYNYWKDMQKIAGRGIQDVNVQFNKFEVVNQDGKPIDIK